MFEGKGHHKPTAKVEGGNNTGKSSSASNNIGSLKHSARRIIIRIASFYRLFRRLISSVVFSSISKRILFLNLAALVVLMVGILYLNQFRDGLIDARVESLLTQSEIIAAAVSASASVEVNSITINPNKLLELQAGESLVPGLTNDDLDFPINPERVAPVLRKLISPTRTRARIFDNDASLILDSQHLYSRGQVLRYQLSDEESAKISIYDRLSGYIKRLLQGGDRPLYKEIPGGDGSVYPEVVNALTGVRGSIVRVREDGELVVSVAVPIQRFRAVLGVLLLSTQGGDIDDIMDSERQAIFRVFGVAAFINIVLSVLLASTIANPLKKLSAAAIRVRHGGSRRQKIPNFSSRQDEIGHLSVALGEMTSALYDRIDTIEAFAADVSHELKNPLTSLRSAVETLPLAKTESSKARLMEVILHDVQRLDRLISDISDASRLDAELDRSDKVAINLKVFLKNVIGILRQSSAKLKPMLIRLTVQSEKKSENDFIVMAHEQRLGQVITNLIENARSFVPEKGGMLDVTLSRKNSYLVIEIQDNGSGISGENVERIFERFYTDRPGAESFGQNSGLGLSISRQIMEAHKGTLTASNVVNSKTEKTMGAKFTIRIPAQEK